MYLLSLTSSLLRFPLSSYTEYCYLRLVIFFLMLLICTEKPGNVRSQHCRNKEDFRVHIRSQHSISNKDLVTLNPNTLEIIETLETLQNIPIWLLIQSSMIQSPEPIFL